MIIQDFFLILLLCWYNWCVISLTEVLWMTWRHRIKWDKGKVVFISSESRGGSFNFFSSQNDICFIHSEANIYCCVDMINVNIINWSVMPYNNNVWLVNFYFLKLLLVTLLKKSNLRSCTLVKLGLEKCKICRTEMFTCFLLFNKKFVFHITVCVFPVCSKQKISHQCSSP